MEISTLTKLDIAALRKADDICFDHNVRRAGRDSERASFVRAIKRSRATETDPYATDTTHRIEVGSGIHSFADGEGYGEATFTAFHMAHNVGMSAALATAWAMLRAGDRLDLDWVRGNSSGYLEEAGLHRDELRLVVRRGDKSVGTFLVAVSVCPDNSARMTQRLYE